MYKHEKIVDDNHEVKEIVDDTHKVEEIVDASDASDEDGEEDDNDSVDDDEYESETDDKNIPFENPSQSDKSDDEATENNSIKCDSCVFLAPAIQRLGKHKCESHSVPGKKVCFKCKREYDTRKEFNNHKYFGCF